MTIDYEIFEDLLSSSIGERKEKTESLEIFFKEKLLAINDKNTVENLKIKEILQKIQQAFVDNKAAQINHSIDEILKNNFLENNNLKKERLKTAFICETIDADYSEFNELEKIVNGRIKFIEFLLSETDESKEFLDFVVKRLKKIKKAEKEIQNYQKNIELKILEIRKQIDGFFTRNFYSYTKNVPMNFMAGLILLNDLIFINIKKTVKYTIAFNWSRQIKYKYFDILSDENYQKINRVRGEKINFNEQQLKIDEIKKKHRDNLNKLEDNNSDEYKKLKDFIEIELNEIYKKTEDGFFAGIDYFYENFTFKNIKKYHKDIIDDKDLTKFGKFLVITLPPLFIIGTPSLFIYLNYKYLVKDKYLTPKMFEEYAELIKEKNKLITQIYKKFTQLSEKIVELKNIPEKELMNLALNSKDCKKIENKFYFNKFDRVLSVIHAYRINDYSENLLKNFNFDILQESYPNKIFPFNIYEKFLGFIEFSIFKAKLVKNSKKNICSAYLSMNGEVLEAKNNNCFSIPKFSDIYFNYINGVNTKNIWHPAFSNFVQNDIDLGIENKNERNALIIAPTGTGKSTFLMQLLSFLIFTRVGIVPAEFAELRFPSKIIQNLFLINGEIGSGTSKHLEERRFINDINSYAENNKDLYIYVVADEICSGTTRRQTEKFAKELLSKTFSFSNISMFLTTHIEEISENVEMKNTGLFNIEVIRNGPGGDFTLTRKLKRGAGFWMDPENKDTQNEFVLYLQKIEEQNKNKNKKS